MRGTPAALALAAAAMAALLAISGGSETDPKVPHGFPGVRPAFLDAEGRADGPRAGIRRDRRWLAQSQPLGAAAPRWARRIYRRSLLVLRALTDLRSGAAVAGAPEGWAYVWPRDAGTVAIALATAGYGLEARRIVGFLRRLDLGAAARFRTTGEEVEGRDAQGDAAGWVAAAEQAAADPTAEPGRWPSPDGGRPVVHSWRDRADYQEKVGGDYLANAIASGVAARGIREAFATPGGLVRRAGDPTSGLDTAAAWAVQPFARPTLYPIVRRTLIRLAAQSGRFGLLPSENWDGGEDPWTAPTAWSAWSLAALARWDRREGLDQMARRERNAALELMAAIRRAATPLGMLPERIDAQTGEPRSTTPLAWSHAFAILALHELWPGPAAN